MNNIRFKITNRVNIIYHDVAEKTVSHNAMGPHGSLFDWTHPGDLIDSIKREINIYEMYKYKLILK